MTEPWIESNLIDVATLQRGFDLPHRARKSGDNPIVTSSGVEHTHAEAKVCAPGVVTGRYGTIGDVFYLKKDFWPLNTTLYVKDFHDNVPLFVYYLLSTINFTTHSGKSGVPGVNRNDLHKDKVFIPPTKAEQEAIAEALSDADALIESLEQLIAKKRQIKQGAMQQLLTGRKRLPEFETDWQESSIRELEKNDVISLYRGNVISKTDIYRTPGIYPIYSSSIHNDGLFGSYGHFMFDEEMITWSVDGGGNFFYRPKHRFSVTNVCGYIRVNSRSACCRYVAYALQQAHSEKTFDYQTKAHPSVIRNDYTLRLPQPEEQTAIAEILSDMDAEITGLETRLAKARQVKQGMMQHLLTGRTRLV